MPSRRQFLRLLAATLPATTLHAIVSAQKPPPSPAATPQSLWLPLVAQAQPPIARPVAPDDAPILAPASGTPRQAFDWLVARTPHYTATDVARIVRAYARIGTPVGIDWFLALAQLCHETGCLTSWWSRVPLRNPAGIGVSGATREGSPDNPPGAEWVWDGEKWHAGWRFPSWANHAVPTHLGLLLAYAVRDEDATAAQLTLMNQTIGGRRLGTLRGIAPTATGLNGRWAVPGTVYGQRIVAISRQMGRARS